MRLRLAIPIEVMAAADRADVRWIGDISGIACGWVTHHLWVCVDSALPPADVKAEIARAVRLMCGPGGWVFAKGVPTEVEWCTNGDVR